MSDLFLLSRILGGVGGTSYQMSKGKEAGRPAWPVCYPCLQTSPEGTGWTPPDGI